MLGRDRESTPSLQPLTGYKEPYLQLKMPRGTSSPNCPLLRLRQVTSWSCPGCPGTTTPRMSLPPPLKSASGNVQILSKLKQRPEKNRPNHLTKYHSGPLECSLLVPELNVACALGGHYSLLEIRLLCGTLILPYTGQSSMMSHSDPSLLLCHTL